MFLAKNWEMFYTESKKDDELVDQISIDVVNKRYMLDKNASPLITDGYDESGEEICSVHISRFIFDMIVAGVKEKGFIKTK